MNEDATLVFRVHAVQQMFRRGVSKVDVRDVIENGEVIEEYPDDLPFPASLQLGWVGIASQMFPLHVVTSRDLPAKIIYVVTVYEPDPTRWENGFRKRK